ncbi:MAG: PA0069 family radical SAM protein [Betaproteobacteria bacterium]|nr:PA0069 family radical SAM protein [Betaproteobacteria bacterium]
MKAGAGGARAAAITLKGRGTADNPRGRFERQVREAVDDGWVREGDEARGPRTEVTLTQARSIISRNDSPDIPFTQSINPYQGCEHGCVYCYARPSHAYLGLSPGLDFETKLFAKANAAELLRAALSRPDYRCEVISLGANTDPYQPIERKYKITRSILEVLSECDHPLGIVTKSALVERDIDLLAPMARKGLVHVFVSIGTLDHELMRRLEPRSSAPKRRLEVLHALSQAGVPCGVLVAPIIPFLNDRDMESVLERSAAQGAGMAGYQILRLPYELKDLFKDWLERHYPLKAARIMSQIRHMRGGRENDPRFGARMSGEGIFAELQENRFRLACERHGFSLYGGDQLDTTRFKPPAAAGQLSLF